MNPALRSSAAHVFVATLEAPQLNPDDAHHLFRVLRLRDGEVVTVSDGVGGWRSTEVVGASLRAIGDIERAPAPARVTIATAIPKGDRAEWMVQKLTELGVGEIVFVDCARSVVRWDDERGAKQRRRLERVAREASMQSRRTWLPTLLGPVPVAEVLSRPGSALAEPDGHDEVDLPRCIVIGPEGGFSPDELAAPVPHIRLSDTILRVETAAIVAGVKFSSDLPMK